MNRTAIAAALLAAAATLTACSSSDNGSSKPATTTPSAAASSALAAAGIPPEPTGQARTDLLAALRAVSPALVTDEDDAVDNARNQCSVINGHGKTGPAAQARFSSSTHTVTPAEAQRINAALKTFCATA